GSAGSRPAATPRQRAVSSAGSVTAPTPGRVRSLRPPAGRRAPGSPGAPAGARSADGELARARDLRGEPGEDLPQPGPQALVAQRAALVERGLALGHRQVE